MDQATYYLKLVVTILGGSHPTRLSGGFLLGLIMKGGSDFGARAVEDSTTWKLLSDTPIWFFIVIGIFLFFLPVFFGRTKLSENNRNYIELVGRVIEKSNLTKAEQRTAWRTLLDKMLEAFKPESENVVDTTKSVTDVLSDQGDPPES